MKNRLLMAVLFIPLFIFFIMLGGIPFLCLVSGIAIFSLLEFYRIMNVRQIKPLTLLGFIIALALLLTISNPRLFPLVMAAGIMVTLIYQLSRKDIQHTTIDSAATIFGVLYVVVLIGHLIPLRNASGGRYLVLTVWFITWIGDSGALIIGRSCGKQKLFPRISPNKTVEGAIGGIASAVLASFTAYIVLKTIFGIPPFPLAHAFTLGLVLGTVGILGDLSESLLKRNAHVKDSSKNIPGHGGVLDIFDSLLFTVPVMYYYVKFFL